LKTPPPPPPPHTHTHTLTCILLFFPLPNRLFKTGLGGFLPWIKTDDKKFEWNVVEYLGWCKAFITFIKYVPQVLMNKRLQSTQGWAIGNVLLDLTGGFLSFGQQGVDAVNQGDWGVFTTDVPKLLLSVESVAFDW
jgi:PQ loop repeat